MKKLVCLLVAAILSGLFSCKSERDDVWVDKEKPKEISIYVSAKVPEVGYTTRAVNETLISSINVMVFENEGDGYRMSYIVPGYSLTNPAPSQYDFYARLSPTDLPVKLYLLANVPGITNILSGGETEEEVQQALVLPFTSEGFDGALPMCGEVEFTDGITDDGEVDVEMVRSVAKVDVVNAAANFTLTSIQVYRAANLYQVVPDDLVNDEVTEASIPDGTDFSVNTIQQIVTDNNSSGQIYIPESPLPAVTARRTATVVVIGGLYDGEDTPTFYRMDFVPDTAPDLFGQVLRNHRYFFTINTVLAPGWRTPEEAAQYESTQIEATVKAWNENTTYMVFDNIYYFGVSSRIFSLPAYAGGIENIAVDTNLDTYQLYWANAQGTIDTSVNPITWGESFTDSDNLYTVVISGNGKQISVTAEDTGAQTKYILAVAGRLRVLLTIEQGQQSLTYRALNVYGSRVEIGSLGDSVFVNSRPGDRVYGGMTSIMRNKQNFGPNGVVKIPEISIAGFSDAEADIPSAKMELFDVMYLTYAKNPVQAVSQRYINWLEANNKRVLIVQYDNTGTNNTILTNFLGFPETLNGQTIRGSRAQTVPFTVYQTPPQQIMEGVFGSVDPTMSYRSYDDIYGYINLQAALDAGVSPILLDNQGNMVLGIDFNRRIIYSGDIDIYNFLTSSRQGQHIVTGNGRVVNDAEKLLANLWAWICNVALLE